MKKKNIIALALFVSLLLCCLAACAGTSRPFTSFKLEAEPSQTEWVTGESCTVSIIEDSGSPDKYAAYIKVGTGSYSKLNDSVTAASDIVVEFSDAGNVSLKVVPVVSGAEQEAKARTMTFVVRSSDITVQDIVIKNNVVDLYTGKSAYDLTALEVEYAPEDAGTKKYTYDKDALQTENLVIQNNMIVARKYISGAEPYVLPVYCPENHDAKANLYIRICAGPAKGDLTNFFVGYVEREYTLGDTVSFQCVAFPNMKDADKYEIYRKKGGDYEKLSDSDFEIVVRGGQIYYDVKVTESGSVMDLRFNAVIDGFEDTSVFSYAKVDLLAADVVPTEIGVVNANDGAITLCNDESKTLVLSFLPLDANLTDVVYSYLEDAEDYVTVSANGVVSAVGLATPPNKPAVIRITSAADDDVFYDLSVYVLNLLESEVAIELVTGSGEYTQTLGATSDIVMKLTGLDAYEHTRLWTVEGKVVSQSNTAPCRINLADHFDNYLQAAVYEGKLEITLTESGIVIERFFTITIQGLIEMEPVASSVSVGGSLALDYTVPDTYTVDWEVYNYETGKKSSDTVAGDEYIPSESGTYYLKAIVKNAGGAKVEEMLTDTFTVIDYTSHEIYSLTVNGYKSGAGEYDYMPVIKWNPLGKVSGYAVEISSGGKSKTFLSDDQTYADAFTDSSFKIPESEADIAGLTKAFSYRVKTGAGNRFTGWKSFSPVDLSVVGSYIEGKTGQNTLTAAELTTVGNFYFTNMKEAADVLNYMLVFRPSQFVSGTKITFDVYFGFNYDLLENKADYETGGAITSDKTDAVLANAEKIIRAVVSAYGKTDTGSFSMSKTGVGITLEFDVANGITVPTKESIDSDFTKVPGQTHYTENVQARATFPVDARTNAISVTNSTELMLALELGFKPVPVAGSVAEAIYDKAKTALNGIVSAEMTDTQKIHAIFDYLSINVTYDSAIADTYKEEMAKAGGNAAKINQINASMKLYKSFYLDGVFGYDDGRQIAVCDGISKAFALMCMIEEIPVVTVSGEGKNFYNTADGIASSSENHAWNMVMIGGKWYNVDATWGRLVVETPSKKYVGIKHYYVGAAAENFEKDHIAVGTQPVASDERLIAVDTVVDAEELSALLSSKVQPIINQTGSGTYLVEIVVATSETFSVADAVAYMQSNLSKKSNEQEVWLSSNLTGTVYILIVTP